MSRLTTFQDPDEPRSGADARAELLARLGRLRRYGADFLDRYELLGEVGRGGMGAILRARDRSLGREVAFKTILRADLAGSEWDEDAVDLVRRFLREAELTSQLDHPGIVPVHELFVDDVGRPMFAMRLIEGVTADVVIKEARRDLGGASLARALDVIIKVADTLAYAHSKGVIHRDIKPTNVMVGRFGEVYLMDWGLARTTSARAIGSATGEASQSHATGPSPGADNEVQEPQITLNGAVLGTPGYMSPEQAEGNVEAIDERTDIYSLGCLLYQLLSGRAPYAGVGDGSPMQLLQQIKSSAPVPLRKLDGRAPPELIAVAERAMARDPQARYQKASLLGDDLRAFLGHRLVAAYGSGPVARLRAWGRGRRNSAAMLAWVLLMLALVSVRAYLKSGPTARPARATDTRPRIEFDAAATSSQRSHQAYGEAWRSMLETEDNCILRCAEALERDDRDGSLLVLRELSSVTRQGDAAARLLLRLVAGIDDAPREGRWPELHDWLSRHVVGELDEGRRRMLDGFLERGRTGVMTLTPSGPGAK